MTGTHVVPLRDDVINADPPGLKGIDCGACLQRSFPARPLCPFCGSAQVQDVALSRRGKVVSWTVVHQAPPPLPTPYRLVTVDLDDGVRLLGAAADNPEIDSTVDVEIFPHKTDPDGNHLWWYRFRKVADR